MELLVCWLSQARNCMHEHFKTPCSICTKRTDTPSWSCTSKLANLVRCLRIFFQTIWTVSKSSIENMDFYWPLKMHPILDSFRHNGCQSPRALVRLLLWLGSEHLPRWRVQRHVDEGFRGGRFEQGDPFPSIFDRSERNQHVPRSGVRAVLFVVAFSLYILFDTI